MTLDTRPRRLISHEEWTEAQRLWAVGGFSDEWTRWRHLAAMEAGIVVPPEGSGWDDWTDEQPSERAILIRAIRETPALLERCIRARGAPTWSRVIALLVRGRDDMRQQATEGAYRDELERASEPTKAEAAVTLARVRDVTGPDGPRILAAVRDGRCPTCGQELPA